MTGFLSCVPKGWYVHTEMFLYLDGVANSLAQENRQRQQIDQQQQQQLHPQEQEEFAGDLQQPAAAFDERQGRQQEQQSKQEQQDEQPKLQQQQQEIRGICPVRKEGRSPSTARKISGDVKSIHSADHQETVEHTPEAAGPQDTEKHQDTEPETELEVGVEPTAAAGPRTNREARNKWTKQDAVEEKEPLPRTNAL